MSYAAVGMMYPVFAPLVSHTPGSMPVYGTGRVIQEARVVTVTKEFIDNPLYGDDGIQDEDNGLSGLQLEFESTGLTDEDREVLFDEEDAITSMGGQWEGTNATPYGGFAYIRKMKDKTASSGYNYEVWLTLKIKFQETRQEARTKEGNQITWGTPTLSGRAADLDIGARENKFRWHDTFTSASAAKAWINTHLNVSAATT